MWYSFIVAFIAYSLFYQMTMPTEIQRQELIFEPFENKLVANISLGCSFVYEGVPAPED